MSSPRVRRGAYTRRCRRCFWTGTYDTAGRADYAKRRHSCTKREQAMLAAGRAADREAGIDRTPKPCHHKQAGHQHGTNAAYVLDRCRCYPCSEAASAAERHRTRQQAYGRYNKYVDADPVRAHVRTLMNAGMGLKTVAKRTGVSTGTLSKLIYGVYAPGPGGRNGNGDLLRPPSRRVLRTTAERLYALDPAWTRRPVPLAPGALDPGRTPAARARLRSLVALGWSMSEVGRRIGVTSPGNACALIGGDRTMTARTVDAANTLFEQMCMTLPPTRTQRQKISVARSKKHAATHSWCPPLALEEDGPSGRSEAGLDEAAIWRRLHGDRVRLTKAEAAETVRRWRASGRTDADGERVTGIRFDRHRSQEDAA